MKHFSSKESKELVFSEVENFLTLKEIQISGKDQNRPWGGYFLIDNHSLERFIRSFFPQAKLNRQDGNAMLSPKVLLVQPEKRLSWQYHNLRSEVWSVISGSVGVIKSDTDKLGDVTDHKTGTTIYVKQGERHRLIGLKEWGVIAEIWQHSNPSAPSSEEDIVRLEDDFGR
ncbi:MAG: phosphoheptose isomerase [Balneolaceae bacterium]|nr:phosphoheptose isomerase [Balneolaceae bacterium]